MIPKRLTYGPEGLVEVQEFLNKNRTEGYTLSIFNTIEGTVVEVLCGFDQIMSVIRYAVVVEHDYPEWIGKNTDSRSYFVALKFTRGCIKAPSTTVWNGTKLEVVS